MSDLVPTLKRELSAVEHAAQTLRTEEDRVRSRREVEEEKANNLRALIRLYGTEELSEADQPKLFVVIGTEQSRAPAEAASLENRARRRLQVYRTPHHGASSKTETVKRLTTELLKLRGKAHRQDILAMLTEKGVMGHEKTPIASLAAYLSDHRHVFEADGRGNYSLRTAAFPEPHPEELSPSGTVEAASPGLHPEPAFSPQIVRDEG